MEPSTTPNNGAGGRQFVERQRQDDLAVNDEVLREDAEAGRAPGSPSSRAGGDVASEAMAQSPYYWAAFTMQGERR